MFLVNADCIGCGDRATVYAVNDTWFCVACVLAHIDEVAPNESVLITSMTEDGQCENCGNQHYGERYCGSCVPEPESEPRCPSCGTDSLSWCDECQPDDLHDDCHYDDNCTNCCDECGSDDQVLCAKCQSRLRKEASTVDSNTGAVEYDDGMIIQLTEV